MSTRHSPHVHQLSLRVGQLPELFNSMDPTPFHDRDLDPAAQEFIESWAMAYPQNSHFSIQVHIVDPPAEDPTATVVAAIHNYFVYRREMAQRALRLLMIEARTSLLIGLAFLAACLIGADALAADAANPALRVLREGLTICGWVALWKPMQMLLYEWWPLARRIRILGNLSRAAVHVLHEKKS